jgi:hypothetical protein
LNELADENFEVIDHVNLIIDVIESQELGIDVLKGGDQLILTNYPNPFRHSTMVSYTIPVDGKVTLDIYNSIGQRVATLSDSFHTAGNYMVKVDGSRFEQGVYSIILRLSCSDGVMSRSIKCIVHK